MEPSGNGPNGGRDLAGRFAPGNPGGPGSVLGARSTQFKAKMLEAVTDEDFLAVVAQLVTQAKDGEEWAVKEFLARMLGRVPQPIVGSDEDGAPMGLVINVVRKDVGVLARSATDDNGDGGRT